MNVPGLLPLATGTATLVGAGVAGVVAHLTIRRTVLTTWRAKTAEWQYEALTALGPQISSLLFAHGAADAASARPLGYMLQAFGLGLIPFSAQYLLLRGFYAFEDTRTPVLHGGMDRRREHRPFHGLPLLLPARWSVVGMAGAYTLPYVAGLALTAYLLRKGWGAGSTTEVCAAPT